ncbi:MAG: DUF6485 family protein [Planctomycetes bacterium]|nr:DUF6485 family protein [Planctomycetota bacterium]
MENLSPFCTCKKLTCAMHPTKHNKGCAPCIAANLKTKELPSCYFNLVEGAETRKGDFFEDFAELIYRNQQKQ